MKINGGDPQPDDFTTQLLGDLDGIDSIAERFGRSLALGIERPAIGGDTAIRSVPTCAHGDEQGRVKPSAILIAAFKVKVGRPGEIRLVPQHGGVAGAGLKPYIDDVCLFAERSATTGGANVSGFFRVPRVRAFAREQFHNGAVGLFRLQQLAAFVAKEDSDGNAPDPLAGDAPVGTSGDHVADALFTPRRNPLYLLDLVKRALAQRSVFHRSFHGDEPLLCSPENHRIVAAPAMRIRVLDFGFRHEHAARLQQLDDRLVGLKDRFTFVLGQAILQMAGFVHVGALVKFVLCAGIKIVRAMRRCGMHSACALFRGDVIRQYAQDRAIKKGMGKRGVLELATGKARSDGCALELAGIDGRFGQGLSDNIQLAIVLQRDVFKIGMKRHGHGSWKRPGSRGPDNG